jgi:hypothetical protein
MSATNTSFDYETRAAYWDGEAGRLRGEYALLADEYRATVNLARQARLRTQMESLSRDMRNTELRARSERRMGFQRTIDATVAHLRQLATWESEMQGRLDDPATEAVIRRLEDAAAYALTKL